MNIFFITPEHIKNCENNRKKELIEFKQNLKKIQDYTKKYILINIFMNNINSFPILENHTFSFNDIKNILKDNNLKDINLSENLVILTKLGILKQKDNLYKYIGLNYIENPYNIYKNDDSMQYIINLNKKLIKILKLKKEKNIFNKTLIKIGLK